MGIVGTFCAFFSGIAVIMDIKWEKVYNFWSYGGWLSCLIVRGISEGSVDWGGALTGTAVPLFILFPLFLGKMIGTGDIKVFAVLGCAMGAGKILQCMILAFLLGAVISLPVLIFRCNIRERFAYFFTYLNQVFTTKTFPAYLAPGKRPENIHFTIPIFGSVLLLSLGGRL
ncbi:MAG: prepilin peptidase [Clostridiales bacterium]|nr:prepilin peptidase [Clostridiales bacterium]